MNKKNKKVKEENESGGAGWLCTFNDLMTLLMVFFVLIFSMGSLDLEKSSGMINSLQSGLGQLEGGTRVDVTVVDPKLSTAEMENDMGNLREVYTQILQDMTENIDEGANGIEEGYSGNYYDKEANEVKNFYLPNKRLKYIKLLEGIEATYNSQGIYITLKDNLLFESGKADISPKGFPVLKRVGDAIKKTPYSIRIEGHTDNQPINTPAYPSNWELSADRAIRVLNFMMEEGNIDPRRLSAVGYGDVKPIETNDTADKRAKNRRVEIVLVNKGIKKNEQ